MRIGELLVKSGIITEEQLNEALNKQAQEKKKLGEILIELGYLTPQELVWLLSEQASIPFIELKPDVLNKEIIMSFPEKLLYQYCIIPLYEIEGKLYVATGNPTDTEGIEKIKEIAKKEVIVSGAEPQKIIELLDKFFLTEETEKILEEADSIKTIDIDISKDGAIVRFTDEKGNAKNYKIKGDITIKFINPKNEE